MFPTPWYLTPMAAAVALLAVTLLLTFCDWRRRKVSRWYDTLLFERVKGKQVRGLHDLVTVIASRILHATGKPGRRYWQNGISQETCL